MFRVCQNLFVLSFLVTLFSSSVAQAEVTLKAPAEINAGATYAFSWSGASHGRDFITIVPVGHPENKYERYVYAGKKTANKMPAPEVPGDYELRYLSNEKPYNILARVSFTVHPVTATVQVVATAMAGEDLAVTWTGPDNPRDFITIVEAGTPETKYGKYAYTNRGNPAKLRAPETAGTYEVRYLSAQNYFTWAAATIEITGTEASVSPPTSVSAGQEFDVPWTGPDNHRDYIALSRPGDRPKLVHYKYTKQGSPAKLLAPDEPGTYEVLYQTGQSSKILAQVSIEVTATTASLKAPAEVLGGEKFFVSWEGPNSPRDHVLMSPNFKSDKVYVGYAYTHLGNPSELQAPLTPGDYLLTYSTGQSGAVLATVNIQVTPPTIMPGTLRVIATESPEIVGASGAVELILDASGSMLKREGGKRRIDTAKAAINSLLGETIPSGTPFAMRVFGHKEAGSCRTDLEIPLGPLDPSKVKAQVSAIEAINLAKTPIGASLTAVQDDLSSARGERVIILITDGEETCGGDPAAVIEAMRQQGHDVRVNIVGFAIDDQNLKETFRFWSNLGGGIYLDAPDAASLGQTLTAALQVPFSVLNEQGDEVATGVVGGEAVALAPGVYRVKAGAREEQSVKVNSELESVLEIQ